MRVGFGFGARAAVDQRAFASFLQHPQKRTRSSRIVSDDPAAFVGEIVVGRFVCRVHKAFVQPAVIFFKLGFIDLDGSVAAAQHIPHGIDRECRLRLQHRYECARRIGIGPVHDEEVRELRHRQTEERARFVLPEVV